MVFCEQITEILGLKTPTLPAEGWEQLELLDNLLNRWDKASNLTGFTREETRCRRYFAEALAAVPWVLAGGRAMDIGSGGGSPALPLAIALPGVQWTLIESKERKAFFLEEAIEALALKNATVVRGRYGEKGLFSARDTVTVRGVALNPEELLQLLGELRPGGRLLWFNGREQQRQFRDRYEGDCVGPKELVKKGSSLLVVPRP